LPSHSRRSEMSGGGHRREPSAFWQFELFVVGHGSPKAENWKASDFARQL
jgi:hypothetical protein